MIGVQVVPPATDPIATVGANIYSAPNIHSRPRYGLLREFRQTETQQLSSIKYGFGIASLTVDATAAQQVRQRFLQQAFILVRGSVPQAADMLNSFSHLLYIGRNTARPELSFFDTDAIVVMDTSAEFGTRRVFYRDGPVLIGGTDYTVCVTAPAFVNVRDAAGNPTLQAFVWVFMSLAFTNVDPITGLQRQPSLTLI